MRVIFIAVFISLMFIPNRSEAKVVEEHIYLVPAGEVEKKVLEDIKKALPDSLPMSVKVVISPQEKISQAAYDPSRKQYDAEMVLDDILRRATIATATERMLVVVDVDLYAQGLNYVFGLSNAKRGICIISLARLRNEFYGLKPDYKLFLKRALKESVHELGHSWDLAHCPNPKCVMYFSNNLSDTDRKKDTFCHDCRKKIRLRYESPLFGSNFIQGII